MKNFLYLLCFVCSVLKAQELTPDENTILFNLKLKCIEGGVFANQQVIFKNTASGTTVKGISDAGGMVKILLPINANYEMQVSNMAEKRFINVPNAPGATLNNTMNYSKNAMKFDNDFKMTLEQIAAVKKAVALLPDTTYYNSFSLKPTELFMSLTITLNNLDKKPLTGEDVTISGRDHKKYFKARSNMTGSMMFLLPKGDTYDISFPLDKNYDVKEVRYMQGMEQGQIQIEYIGTAEIIKRAKERIIRMKEDSVRRDKERKEFEAYMKKEKLSAVEAHKKEIKEYLGGTRQFKDDVILKAFDRNKWKDKLIVTDLTGSMSPYASQLQLWYSLNYAKEQNLQFVFFNDGDNRSDEEKKIGETGGIYYYPSKGLDSVMNMIAYVEAAGGGGDCPENNMEALIKGTKLARPFKELVMIADNLAPVKDIALLGSFHVPVRIILCGVSNEIEPDYLRIAHLTKGSVHTMEEDILQLGTLLDGQEVKIGKCTYRLMKGKFIALRKS